MRLALRLSNDQHLAEELTQDTMLRAVQNLDQLRSPDRLVVWLLQITTNLWRDQSRRGRTRPKRTTFTEPVDTTYAAEDAFERREQMQQALAVMQTLPEKQRVSLHLFAVEQLSVQEIADVLNSSANAVKVNLFHARTAMRQRLPNFLQDTGSQ